MGLPPRDKAATRPRRVQTFISYHGQAGAAAWRKARSRGEVASACQDGQAVLFAAPASSAGVERVFSAAGKMHGDLQKAAKDSTLEHSLFAAFNTD